MSCVSRIYYFRLCLFEHSCCCRWFENCVWEYIGQGKIACCSRWWCPFHHLQELIIAQRMALQVPHIIFGWILSMLFSNLKVRRLKSIRTPPMVALTEFCHADAETKIIYICGGERNSTDLQHHFLYQSRDVFLKKSGYYFSLRIFFSLFSCYFDKTSISVQATFFPLVKVY